MGVYVVAAVLGVVFEDEDGGVVPEGAVGDGIDDAAYYVLHDDGSYRDLEAVNRARHPYARLGLALQESLAPLPEDTRYQVRLASVLGGKYLEIIPGHSTGHGLPDGGYRLYYEAARADGAHELRTELPRSLTGRVDLLGVVSETDKARLLASLDVYCAPNLGMESFGIILLEAMAAGTAIAASNLEPFRKVLRGGSWATHPSVMRPSFRNWDLPQRRQIFSGIRCARDA